MEDNLNSPLHPLDLVEDIPKNELEKQIREFLSKQNNWDDLREKNVRRYLEQHFSLSPKALNSRKAEIQAIISSVIDETEQKKEEEKRKQQVNLIGLDRNVYDAESDSDDSDEDYSPMIVQQDRKKRPRTPNANKKSPQKRLKKKAKLTSKPRQSRVVQTTQPRNQQSGLIDPSLEYTHHIISQQGREFSVMLNQTNIDRNNNKFYQIQLVKHDSVEKFILLCKWGRVGARKPRQSAQDFHGRQQAISEFMKKFRGKTRNIWGTPFVAVEKKYTIVEVIDPADEESSSDDENVPMDGQPAPESLLPEKIQKLVEMICSKELRAETMKSMDIDLTKLPLGRLSKQQISRGYTLLRNISSVIQSGHIDSQLTELTNRFYTLIPHNFGMKRPPVINSGKMLKRKIQLLETLADIEIASRILKSTRGDKTKHPIDRHFAALRTQIDILGKESETFQLIEQMIASTHASTHCDYKLEVQEIFTVDRENSMRRFAPFKLLHNHKLLWHGSRLANFVGILREGLRIAPPEAPATGYMFGKGIYFADSASKSANYINATKSQPIGLLVLSQVALGDMYELKAAKYLDWPPVPYHSTKGIGKTCPNPQNSKQINGTFANMGPLIGSDVEDTSLQYNEYIVYDVGAVKMKYLVKVKFHFIE